MGEKLFASSDKLRGQNDPQVNPAHSLLILHEAHVAYVNICLYIKVTKTQLLLSGHSLLRNRKKQWAIMEKTLCTSVYSLDIQSLNFSAGLSGLSTMSDRSQVVAGTPYKSTFLLPQKYNMPSFLFLPSPICHQLSHLSKFYPVFQGQFHHTNPSHLWTVMNFPTMFTECIACDVCAFWFPNYIMNSEWRHSFSTLFVFSTVGTRVLSMWWIKIYL